jgi:hypothetical protein
MSILKPEYSIVITNNFINSANELYNVLNQVKQDNSRDILVTIEIDLTKVDFFVPPMVIQIAQCCIFLRNNNNKVALKLSSSKSNQYIKNIGLTDFCEQNYTEPQILYLKPQIGTTIPLRRLSQAYLAAYTDCIGNYFKAICIDKDVSIVNICIAELLNNVYDHSAANGAFIFSQYYPAKKYIKIVVSDLGHGIPQKVKEYLTTEGINLDYSEADCLKWATKLKNSTKSKPHNAGKGLNTIISGVTHLNSTIKIYSNGVLWRDENVISNPIVGFIGTLVEITLHVEYLKPVDNNVLDELPDDFW